MNLVPRDARRVLDVGCSTGKLGLAIKQNTSAEVFGIELSQDMAKIASERLDKVLLGDVEEILLHNKLQGFLFDTVIFADILEHLKDPWTTLKETVNFLQPQGVVIVSIPNVRHLDTIFNLVLRGNWPYRDRGVHDRTHLRFFTRKNIVELINGSGLTIETITENFRIIERPHIINRLARLFAVPPFRDLIVFQYLVVAKLKIS